MLTLSSRAYKSVVISFLVCVPPLLSEPITSHTLHLIKNKKILLDECTSKKAGGHWKSLEDTKQRGLVTGRCFYLLAAVAVLYVVSWRQGGAEGGNFLSTDIWLNPDREPISGCSAGSWPQLQQRSVWQQLSRYMEVRSPPAPVHIPNRRADEERRSDCICHSCLCEVSAHPSVLRSENHGMCATELAEYCLKQMFPHFFFSFFFFF